MKHVGAHLLSKETVADFFNYVDDYPKPDLAEVHPTEALKNYIAECGGDAEKTIVHLAPPPPPVSPEIERRPTIRCVTRTMTSPLYAMSYGVCGTGWTRLLCCWDDPAQLEQCIRENCPYLHVSDLLKQHPIATPLGLYESIPCTFAGMDKKCKWHRHQFQDMIQWEVPPFELETSEGEEPKPPVAEPPSSEGAVEFVPKFNGTRWVLLRRGTNPVPKPSDEKQKEISAEAAQLEQDMKNSILNYLDGYEDDE